MMSVSYECWSYLASTSKVSLAKSRASPEMLLGHSLQSSQAASGPSLKRRAPYTEPLLAQQMPRAERVTPSMAAASWMAWLTCSGDLKISSVLSLQMQEDSFLYCPLGMPGNLMVLYKDLC